MARSSTASLFSRQHSMNESRKRNQSVENEKEGNIRSKYAMIPIVPVSAVQRKYQKPKKGSWKKQEELFQVQTYIKTETGERQHCD
jgi:hypothetical protein